MNSANSLRLEEAGFSVLFFITSFPKLILPLFFSHGSASIITNGWKWNHTVYRRSFLVQEESNSNQAFMDEILVWLKKIIEFDTVPDTVLKK